MKRRRYKPGHRYETIQCSNPNCRKIWSQTVQGGIILICRLCGQQILVPHLLKETDIDSLLNSEMSDDHIRVECSICKKVFRVKKMWINQTAICLCGKKIRISGVSIDLEQKIATGKSVSKPRRKMKKIS